MEAIRIYIEYCARGLEVLGVVIIVLGTVMALGKYVFDKQAEKARSYKLLRQELGKVILLGLEILVAGDIVATVSTEPTMDGVIILGIIVLIRTFLSLSIEVEIEGKLPWKKGNNEEADRL
jgi:uncharacterized membrane protein